MNSTTNHVVLVTESEHAIHIPNTTTYVYIREGPSFRAAQDAANGIFIYPLIMISLLAVVGAAGNSIVLYIYGFKWKYNKTRIFILCLGILDIINCVFNMPVEMAVLMHPLDFNQNILCKISRGCTYVINNTGSLVFVAIAIDRYLCVYHPFMSRRLTSKWAKCMCLLAFVVAATVSSPSFVFYGTHTLTLDTPLDNVKIQGKTCLISDEHAIHMGIIFVYTLFLFTLLIIIFVILIILYVAIGRKIHKATTNEDDNTKNATSREFCKNIISAFSGNTRGRNLLTTSHGGNTTNPRRSPPRSPLLSESMSVNSDPEIMSMGILRKTPKKTQKTRKINSTLNGNRKPLLRRFSTVNFHATRKNTLMMRMVTIAFMASFTPFLVIVLMRYSLPELYKTWSKQSWFHLLLRSYFINSAVNPWIYGFMNRQFRSRVADLLRTIFCSTCCTGKDASRRPDVFSSAHTVSWYTGQPTRETKMSAEVENTVKG